MSASSIPSVTVAVPVRDESASLPGLFEALAIQQFAGHFTLVLYSDGCSDDGYALAQRMASRLPFAVACRLGERAVEPNVGLARRRACALALALDRDAALSTTDADSAPDPFWLAAGMAGLDKADVVCGMIVPRANGASSPCAALRSYLDLLHKLRRKIDPVAWEDERTHHWTSAASLAFAPGVYTALEGFATLPFGEDADLCDRAWRHGYRLRRDARVVVHTSDRRVGRVQGGFAGLLAALDRTDTMPMVAHPADEVWRYRHHALARWSFESGNWSALARSASMDPDDVMRVAAEVANGDAFAARVIGTPPGGMRTVALTVARALLDRIEVPALAVAV